MSNRLTKKKVKNKLHTGDEINQLQVAFSIYDSHFEKLFRLLSRKTNKIEWKEQNYPFLPFNGLSNIESSTEWLLPADNSRNKHLHIESDGSLSVEMDLINGDSFYLQTGSMNINGLPLDKNSWRINGGFKYRLVLNASYGENRPECAIFIIQYDENKRITHKYQLIYNGINHIEFDTMPDARYFSMALRFKGQGSLRIEPIKLYIEETLPVNAIRLDNCQSHEEIIRHFEVKAKTLTKAFETRILSLPESPQIQKQKIDELKDKLVTALYEKQKLERSLYYRLGKTMVETKRSSLKGFLSLPQKLIKIRAAKRKGKFDHPPLNCSVKKQLLESVGVYNEVKHDNEISWPVFESHAHLRNQHINVVTICDKFTYECFRYEANFIPLTKQNWKSEIDESHPVMLFLESAWNGNNGEWTYTMVSYKKHLGDPLRKVIKYCQSKNIPVVFWNKEDPTNYEVFIDVAADCDYIFTTDGNILEKYKSRVGHNRVYALPFAAQPAIHNPIRDKNKKLPVYEVCFAGSWYNNGHDTRRAQTEIVLDGTAHRELHIYDRMLHATKHRESRIFPEKYQPFIVGSLDYEQMLTAYRQYKLFLNINTVQDSPTMFSRRVFEILACGTPVVSTHSDGMKAMLGNHVHIVNNKDEAKNIVQQLLKSDLRREILGHQAARHCLLYHSYEKRFKQILNTVGINTSPLKDDKISIIICTNRLQNIDMLIDNYQRQSHENKELLLILNNDDFDIDLIKNKTRGIPNVYIYQLSQETTLGDCLNYGVAHASGHYIAKMDDDDYYGGNYLLDALLAFNYSGADVIGKDSYFCYVESKNVMAIKQPGKDNRFSDFVSGGTLIIKKYVFEKIKFQSCNRGEDTNFLKECKMNGFTIYSSDKYNFIQMRYKNTAAHTWQIQDEDYLKNCQVVKDEFDKKLSFI
ncbi:TPA: glycosyltransferase family protein [Escherichia coli]|uniref:glycosyltransferase family protein n=1 Tax=Escherichia coli TaxID=562 RepID=UPI0005A5FEB9|nr:glycosyltransferase [Escherichia coli]HAI6150869.1 glycosyltransferase [Escherichia coli]HBM4899100.1 glycosyltransferase [Escherichia coli]HEA6968952.1 glycosyltransferase [Escherichia coli]